MRVLISMVIILSCMSCERYEPKIVDQDSSHTKQIFFVSARDLVELKRSALSGNDKSLKRVIDYYRFSSTEADRDSTVIYWTGIGARRRIKEHAFNYLSLVNEQTGKCEYIIQIARNKNVLSEEEMNEILRDNLFVKYCLDAI